jgi:hypothetical protein
MLKSKINIAVTRTPLTQLQLDQIAKAARSAAFVDSQITNPLESNIVAELIGTKTLDVSIILAHWDINYNLEYQKLTDS